MHGLQNSLDNRFVAHSGIDHQVVERTRGPVGIEIMLHKSDALPVYGIDSLFRIRFAQPILPQAAELFRARGVKKNVKSGWVLAQKIWSAAPDDDRIAFLGDLRTDLFHHRHHAIGIEHLVAELRAALVTAAPEGFG